jgi:hypothetical protein
MESALAEGGLLHNLWDAKASAEESCSQACQDAYDRGYLRGIDFLDALDSEFMGAVEAWGKVRRDHPNDAVRLENCMEKGNLIPGIDRCMALVCKRLAKACCNISYKDIAHLVDGASFRRCNVLQKIFGEVEFPTKKVHTEFKACCTSFYHLMWLPGWHLYMKPMMKDGPGSKDSAKASNLCERVRLMKIFFKQVGAQFNAHVHARTLWHTCSICACNNAARTAAQQHTRCTAHATVLLLLLLVI